MDIKIISKKALLLFFGLILSLLVLEIFLQSVSFPIKHIKNYKTYCKYKFFKTKNSITILCIGESTTSGQYPVQLQRMLNNINPGRFKVVDCGLPAITIETINEEIENNIKIYNPDIVLFMMGINDGFYSLSESVKNNSQIDLNQNKQQLKIYKLALLLKMHITSFLKIKTDTYDNLKLKIESLNQDGKFIEASQLLEKVLKKKPDNEYAYIALTKLYCDFLDDKNFIEIGYKMALKGLDMDFIEDKVFFYKTILEYNVKYNNLKKIKFYTDKAINDDIFKTYDAFVIYRSIKDVISVEQKKRIISALMQTQTPDKSCGLMAIESITQGNLKKAEEYFNTAEELRLNFPNKKTYQLYKLILQKTLSFNTKIICMQYPVRSIEPLKNMLKSEDYYNKITFVSNENIFKQMLKKYSYEDIFRDQFVGDFGHCTAFGNQLIAENVSKTIVDLTK